MKGQKPISNELKRLRGTDQPVNMRQEGNFEKLTKVSTPSQLTTKRAKAIFRAKSSQLINANVLTAFDVEQLTIYSDLLDQYFVCGERVEKEGLFIHTQNKSGSVVLVEHPASRLKRQLAEQITRLGASFGFDPASRLRFKYDEPKQTDDGLMEFLR